ncbi:MAG: insulinase family protein [Bacilli bacterium]|nr:insulinase family protein [Bacilli bacterium]
MKELKFDSVPYIIRNKNYSTITFKLIYSCNYEEKDLVYINLLQPLISNYSKKCKIEQEFKLELVKRLIINMTFKKMILNDNLFLTFTLTVPDPKRVKDFNIENAFSFFYDMIYNPNVSNGEFDKKQLEREREYIKSNLNESLKRISNFSYQRFISYFDDKSELKNNMYNNIDLLDKVTPKDLYKYYKSVIIDNTPICIVYGDVDKEKVNTLYYKYFKKNDKPIIINKNYNCYLIPKSDTSYIEEKSDYNQSALYFGYKIEKMSEKDRIYLSLLCNILCSRETNLIFNALRVDNNLIYSYNFGCKSKNAMFFIEAYISKNSKDKTITIIDEMFRNIKNKNKIKEYIDKILVGIEYELIESKDSKYFKLNEFIAKKSESGFTLKEIYNGYKKINIDKFLKFLERVKLDTIYFLRGEANEKE